jgi:hypothetical protein
MEDTMSDATKPWDGRPENPERDGWHWLQRKRHAPQAVWWCHAGAEWEGHFGHVGLMPASRAADDWRYLRPCPPPAEIDALVAERDALRARVEKLEAGIARAMDEAEDAGPKALKYVTQELRDALAAAPAPEDRA